MDVTAQQIEVETLGIRTKAWTYGAPEGPAVVLVHGFRGDHHGLEGLAIALAASAPELRLIVPDLPGFGESPAVRAREHDLDLYGEWLRAFVTGVSGDTSQAAILGHSFGSLVVANSLGQGLQPASIILMNPIASPALKGPAALMTGLTVAYYRLAEMLPEPAARAVLGNSLIVRVMSEFMAKTRDRTLRAWIHDQHHRYFSRFSDSTTLLQAFRASVSHTVTEYAQAFRAPTLVIAGDRDDLTPLSRQLILIGTIADAHLRIMPGVGHLLHYEAVEDSAAEIVSFLCTEHGS